MDRVAAPQQPIIKIGFEPNRQTPLESSNASARAQSTEGRTSTLALRRGIGSMASLKAHLNTDSPPGSSSASSQASPQRKQSIAEILKEQAASAPQSPNRVASRFITPLVQAPESLVKDIESLCDSATYLSQPRIKTLIGDKEENTFFNQWQLAEIEINNNRPNADMNVLAYLDWRTKNPHNDHDVTVSAYIFSLIDSIAREKVFLSELMSTMSEFLTPLTSAYLGFETLCQEIIANKNDLLSKGLVENQQLLIAWRAEITAFNRKLDQQTQNYEKYTTTLDGRRAQLNLEFKALLEQLQAFKKTIEQYTEQNSAKLTGREEQKKTIVKVVNALIEEIRAYLNWVRICHFFWDQREGEFRKSIANIKEIIERLCHDSALASGAELAEAAAGAQLSPLPTLPRRTYSANEAS